MKRIHLDPSLCLPLTDPRDLICRTFLLPPEENGERHRAKVTRQVVEIIDQDNGQRIENINLILDIGNGKVEELISYNQLLEHLENAQDRDMGMDQELYRFRAIIGHQGPLLASAPDWKGSKYNVQVEWETGEITFEPLSIIATDDPVTCAACAKENDLLALEGWRRFRSLAKKDKSPRTMGSVEKPLFSIGLISSCADQFSSLFSPMQRLLLYMYLSQLLSTFTNYLKVHRSLDGYFIQ